MTEGAPPPADQRALYLRWRPRSFAEVVGQDSVTRTLRNAVARGTVSHGYLLCGPRGTGKTSLARILFKALNCLAPRDGDPCGACRSCEAADAGRALDLIEIDAASNRGIDDIRALRERVRYAATDATWKVYIVDEAHQLTPPAWDAFLKTLEEPPPHTVFVMATTAAHRVPATIVSRCQRFDLRRIAFPDIVGRLEQIAESEGLDLEPGVADRVARLSRGGMRDAIGMLEQVAAFSGSHVTADATRRVLGLVRGDALRSFIDALSMHDARQAFEALEEVADEGADLRQFLDELVLLLRAALLIRSGAESAIVSEIAGEERTWLRGVAERWAPGQLLQALRRFACIVIPGLDERQLLARLEIETAASVDVDPEPLAPPVGTRVLLERPGDFVAPPPPAYGEPATHASPALETSGGRASAGAAEPPPTPESSGVLAPAALESTELLAGQELLTADHPTLVEPAPTAPRPGESPALPSLASVQARWPQILDLFRGSLLAKMALSRAMPTRIDSGVVTIEAKMDRLELQRLESGCRPALEELLTNQLGAPVQVRLTQQLEAAAADPEGDSEMSVAAYAARLFGGRLIVDEPK